MSVLTSAVEANTQYESFQRLTLSKNLGSRAMSMSQEHLQSSSPDYEIPMLHNPQSMNIMQSEPWTSLDKIKPANQKDSLLLPLVRSTFHLNLAQSEYIVRSATRNPYPLSVHRCLPAVQLRPVGCLYPSRSACCTTEAGLPAVQLRPVGCLCPSRSACCTTEAGLPAVQLRPVGCLYPSRSACCTTEAGLPAVQLRPCVNTGIGGLRRGTTRRSTGKKVILSKALWHATGTTRHKRNRGRPLHPSLYQAVSTLFVDELRKSSSLKSKSSHKSFCHHQPRPIDQNNKCCGDGRTTNRQMRALWKP
ncbi:hypothetical protein DPMN_033422 [Dreissena polymorpha]|uniref:Uncharacterized protein n=1 Tax=Dreissena polymorpha TaxID=45954 RepID=A0A9D4RL47_DREPO|nr:hypothetical protein DPMN_033422 [Dreissena polymorpha]